MCNNTNFFYTLCIYKIFSISLNKVCYKQLKIFLFYFLQHLHYFEIQAKICDKLKA